MSRKIKVCAIQPKFPQYLEHENEAVLHAVELLEKAGTEKPDIICLPELYPFWDREELYETAKKIGSYVLAGVVEFVGGHEYNTMILIDRNGNLVGRQRKVHRAYSVEFHTVDDEYRIFQTDFGKIGVLICIDGWGFPEGFYYLAKHGAEIIFNPSIIFRKKPQRRMACLAKSMEYRIPIISNNNAEWAFKRSSSDIPLPANGGGSLIVSPPAELAGEDNLAKWMKESASTENWIVSELANEEEIVFETFDLDALKKLRSLWDDCLGKTRLI